MKNWHGDPDVARTLDERFNPVLGHLGDSTAMSLVSYLFRAGGPRFKGFWDPGASMIGYRTGTAATTYGGFTGNSVYTPAGYVLRNSIETRWTAPDTFPAPDNNLWNRFVEGSGAYHSLNRAQYFLNGLDPWADQDLTFRAIIQQTPDGTAGKAFLRVRRSGDNVNPVADSAPLDMIASPARARLVELETFQQVPAGDVLAIGMHGVEGQSFTAGDTAVLNALGMFRGGDGLTFAPLTPAGLNVDKYLDPDNYTDDAWAQLPLYGMTHLIIQLCIHNEAGNDKAAFKDKTRALMRKISRASPGMKYILVPGYEPAGADSVFGQFADAYNELAEEEPQNVLSLDFHAVSPVPSVLAGEDVGTTLIGDGVHMTPAGRVWFSATFWGLVAQAAGGE